jgi:hypothetical protein
MRTKKVVVQIRIRSNGRYTYSHPVWNRNRTLRNGFALVDGQPQYHPEGVYYIRFSDKREPVGRDGDTALPTLRCTSADGFSQYVRRQNQTSRGPR